MFVPKENKIFFEIPFEKQIQKTQHEIHLTKSYDEH